MKHLTRFINTLFVAIFFFQSSAMAAGATSAPIPSFVMESIVENYNALNQKQRLELFKEGIKKRPESDQKFIQQHMNELSRIVLPDLKFGLKDMLGPKRNQISFQFGADRFFFTLLDDQKMIVKDKTIDFGDGKLQKAYQQLEKLFGAEKVGLIDLLMSSAYAEPLTATLVGLIIVFFSALLFLIHSDYSPFSSNSRDRSDKILANCKEKIEELDQRLSSLETDLKTALNELKPHAERQLEFSNSRLENALYLDAREEHGGWVSANRVKNWKALQKCSQDMLGKINLDLANLESGKAPASSVNNEQRDASVKEVNEQSSSDSPGASAAGQ